MLRGLPSKRPLLVLISFCALLPACTGSVAEVEGDDTPVLAQSVGLASWYGAAFEGQPTASGEIFDKEEMVAAHPTYPLGSLVRVTNLENGRVVAVRVIDRGPTRPNRREGVIIDLSRGAAVRLGFRKEGRTQVKVEVLRWGPREEGSPKNR